MIFIGGWSLKMFSGLELFFHSQGYPCFLFVYSNFSFGARNCKFIGDSLYFIKIHKVLANII